MELLFAYDGQNMMAEPQPHTPLFDPKPLVETGRKWSRWLGPAISLAVIVAILFQLQKLNIAHVQAIVPVSPLFWLLFIASYFIGPYSDWLIFRRLWNVPMSAFAALVRKQVTNALLPSYSGEVYFYAWARKHTELTGAPFGAIKDVAILSALMGNLVTLIMMGAVYALFSGLLSAAHFGTELNTFALSIGFVTLTSLLMMAFRARLFSLPSAQLLYASAIILLRIVVSTLMVAFLWHLIMPEVALGWWVLLSTLKMLLSRLPFVPNQDGLFAGVAIILIGNDQPLTNMVAMFVIASNLTHILFGAILGILDLVQTGVRRHA